MEGDGRMSATEELRALLDERGAEHYDGTETTLWLKDGMGYRASADEGLNGFIQLHLWCTTPEQAIAATLGDKPPKKCSTCQYRYVVGQRPYPTFGYVCGFGDGKNLCGDNTSVLDHMGCEHWEKELK